jgi:lipoyl(octanoyl) transferase
VTYHGPGQLVGYPIFRLAGPRVVDFVRALETVNIAVAAAFDVAAGRIDGLSGVWVDDAKLTAIGVHVTAGRVTTHGWATNVATDLADFAGIVPCGIADKSVTSLRALGVDATMDAALDATERAVADVFGCTVDHVDASDLGLGLSAGV